MSTTSTNDAQNTQPRKRRKMSPEQRQRMLRERRRRAFRRRLCISLIGVAVLIAAAVALMSAFRGGVEREKPEVVVASAAGSGANSSPEELTLHLPGDADAAGGGKSVVPRAAEERDAQGEQPAPEREDAAEVTVELPPLTPEPSPTPEPTFTPAPTEPVVMDERISVAMPTYDPSAPFSYQSGYISAVQGVDTGAAITPDYSNVSPKKLDRWPSVEEGFMPMLTKANTDKNIIAVTVDDCFQGENLKKIVSCALKNNAKLTIFPIGENLEKPSVAKVIKSAWQKGMEIENHTYSHKGTYHYDDDAMADDIWKQSDLLNQVLGVNYKEHFYRPKGGDERFDQRSHAYINQLGFSAMALWTQSGSVDPMSDLLSNLGPGRIYLFHTTDNDLKKLLKFIPAAVKKGYKLVTLNEMFGLPDNETSDISTAPVSRPALQAFHVQPMALKTTSYARAAAVVQQRLIDLGWMKGESTGVYGNTTHACMAVFQSAAGLPVDGEASIDTQRVLFSDAAPVGSESQIRTLASQLSSGVQSAIAEMFNS